MAAPKTILPGLRSCAKPRAALGAIRQIVRNWLLSPESGWDRAGDEPPPALPAEVVERTRARYIAAYELLTGETF